MLRSRSIYGYFARIIKPPPLEYLLFIAYLVLFAWLVTRTRFFLNTGLSKPQIMILFLTKVMAGIFYGWIGSYYGGLAQMSDTWNFNMNGVLEHKLLLSNPHEYFTNLFHNPYGNSFSQFFKGDNSYWNDLKSNSFIKLLSVFDIFSGGLYYVNVIFYSFIALFGPMALYRVMKDVFPRQKLAVLIATFLTPSFLYWTSGIHKEGMLTLGMALVIYHFYFGWKEQRWSVKRISLILLGLLLLLMMRNVLFVMMVPALLVWGLANRVKKRSWLVFAGMYALFTILFFTTRYIDPDFDFPNAVVTKQREFVDLVGNSSVAHESLQPTAASFLGNMPHAITMAAIRPYPSDVRHILSLAAAVEIELLLLLLGLFLFVRSREDRPRTPNFVWFCLFFGLSVLLAIGFSVNNLGAIVRYRSVIMPLLVVPMAAQIDWKRIERYFSNNIKNINNN